ncbi:phage tail tube protein [Chengkuizengella sp. SCS-71B]|uniref:phage tail tube protein n=1 Tax=Chengkuizengella sp. SCS-71B TaxID=3115290 RepID=UPI0032C2398D
MALNGIDIVILANTGTEAEPNFTVVGGQRGATLEEVSETVDVTNKGSNGSYEYEYGLYGFTISAEGVYIPDDAAYVVLKNAIRTKEKVLVQWKEGAGNIEQGLCLVTSRSVEGPYDGEATYSFEFQGTGTLTTNP